MHIFSDNALLPQPTLPTALNLELDKDENGKIISHAWHKIDSKGKEGIEPCTAVGGGVVMIHKDVFEATKKPWYDVVGVLRALLAKMCISASRL